MTIFGTNSYENLEVVGVIALLLCNRDYFEMYLATTSRLSLKSKAVCACMYPPLF